MFESRDPWLRRQWANARDRRIWKEALWRTGAGWQPIDMFPFELALWTILAGVIGVDLLVTEPLDAEFVGLAVAAFLGAVVSGLVWLLWTPPWMRDRRDVFRPFGSREAQFGVDHPLYQFVISSAVWLGMSAWAIAEVRNAWPLVSNAAERLVIAGALGVGIAGVCVHAAVICRFRVGPFEQWVLRHFVFVMVFGWFLVLLGSPAQQIAGAGLGLPLFVYFPISALARLVWIRRDRVAADAYLARMAKALGQGWRPSTIRTKAAPIGHVPEKHQGQVGYHFPPDSMRHPLPTDEREATPPADD